MAIQPNSKSVNLMLQEQDGRAVTNSTSDSNTVSDKVLKVGFYLAVLLMVVNTLMVQLEESHTTKPPQMFSTILSNLNNLQSWKTP